ncbi:MAG: hypothetical protein ACC742_08620 [Thermoanaerobaculales bacterium]
MPSRVLQTPFGKWLMRASLPISTVPIPGKWSKIWHLTERSYRGARNLRFSGRLDRHFTEETDGALG